MATTSLTDRSTPATVSEAPSITPRPHRIPTGFARTFSSLSNHNFLVLWCGMLASYLAMQLQQVARGYLAYEIGGTATTLGIVTLAMGGPMLLLSPLGGVMADRWPKRNVLMVTQAVAGLSTLVNAILISLGHIEVWHLAVISLVQGATFAFNMPARQALIPEIVGRDQMMNAIAINNAGLNLTRVLGPTLAGFAISIPFIGIAGAFYGMAACYLLVLVTLFQIPAIPPVRSEERRGSILQEMTSGMRYIWNNQTLLTLVGMAFVPVLLAMPYQSLMPVFAKEFGVGSEGLGFLMGAAGLGALAGSLTVAYFSESPGKERIQLMAGVGFGVALVVFCFAPTFLLGVLAMIAVGVANNVYMSLNNTLIMSNCESSMHGRVMSVYMMTFSLMPLTTLPMSALADVVGPRLTVGGAGALTATIIAAAALAIPAFRKTV